MYATTTEADESTPETPEFAANVGVMADE